MYNIYGFQTCIYVLYKALSYYYDHILIVSAIFLGRIVFMIVNKLSEYANPWGS